MNWIKRFLGSRAGASLGKTEDQLESLPMQGVPPQFSDAGILYEYGSLDGQRMAPEALFEWAASMETGGQQALYLAQLVEEGLARATSGGFLIEWPDAYFLATSDDHGASMALLQVPPLKPTTVKLEERGTVSDPDFAIHIAGWIDGSGHPVNADHQGAVLRKGGEAWLMPGTTWTVVSKLLDFRQRSVEHRNQKANEAAWGDIRAAALRAKAKLSPYLAATIVLTPESLELSYSKTEVIGTSVVTIEPGFEGAPDHWLQKFDELSAIPGHLDFASGEGRTRVIFSDPVRAVLQTIKRDFPGRRAGGARAEAFIRNPYAFLGEDAHKVIQEEQIQEAKQRAGIVPTRLTLEPVTEKGVIRKVVGLVFQSFDDGTGSAVREDILSAAELETLLDLMQAALADERQYIQWRGHTVDVDGDTRRQCENGERYLAVWRQQGQNFIQYEDIYALDNYSERIEGIGVAKPLYSPFIKKEGGDQTPWAPENLTPLLSVPLPPDGTRVFIQLDRQWLDEFDQQFQKAKAAGETHVINPRLPIPVPTAEAEQLIAHLRQMLGISDPSTIASEPVGDEPNIETGGTSGIDGGEGGNSSGEGNGGTGGNEPDGSGKPAKKSRETLLLKANIAELDYTETQAAAAREQLLRMPEGFKASLSRSKRPEIKLKPHQVAGVAWLQFLLTHAPDECRGALLADDMGLGKTLQLLTVLAAYYEANPAAYPSLIVAPVALLQNWRNEAAKFFVDFPEILLLHGEQLANRRQPRALIDAQLVDRKITNLLIPNWLGSAKIVLTTYDVLRDYEFSLARQSFAFMICDEAQKIKTPNALVTLAAKKQKALFRIACTGTPVENTLADLWCLFDFIQPGLLGALDEFGKAYRRPIEAKTESQKEALALLRTKISPQLLRRTKEDIKDQLPRKEYVANDSYEFEGRVRQRLRVPLSRHQRGLYAQGLQQLRAAAAESDARRRANLSFGVLHFIKAVCAEPYCLPRQIFALDTNGSEVHLANSPKLKWMLEQLQSIAGKGEKAIIFTEIREVQRALVYFIRDRFGFTPAVINGDTDERQEVIDRFQERPGFGAIILSPLAAGFGLNIVSANHVIHYTRTWNPAKEGQATDRAYRIGQTKDVYVYCPTVVAEDFVTFEDKLDRLMSTKMDLASDMLDGVGADIPRAQLLPDEGPAGTANAANEHISIDDVDRLDGFGFEVFCKLLWQQKSMLAYVTRKRPGDGGVDVVAIGNDGTGVHCQCKHTTRPELGWEGVKEIFAGSPEYQARHPRIRFEKVALCNWHFNADAKAKARTLGVRLIERQEIIRMLQDVPIKRAALDEELLQTSPVGG